MNREIGHAVAKQVFQELRGLSYDGCRKLMENISTRVVRGTDGRDYQLESEAFWDGKKSRNIRLLVSARGGGIDDFIPSTAGFIISPDGSFVGEDSN